MKNCVSKEARRAALLLVYMERNAEQPTKDQWQIKNI